MISVAIANYNGAAFLRQAVASALAQRGVALEILIVDDCSTDDSWAIMQELAASDDRIRCWRLPENRGPAGARNHALRHATGRWFAVFDNDDLIHPDRLKILVEAADGCDATMIADDLIVFDDAGITLPATFLKGARTAGEQWIGLADYLAETRMFGRSPNLGFLKPVIRRDFLTAAGLSYDERLRIAEDDDLILRALLAGARYRLLPRPLYFYRKHATSISHRLSAANADRMVAASERLGPDIGAAGPVAARALHRRNSALRKAWGYAHLREALMRRDPVAAIRVILRTPSAALLLHQPVAAVFRRLADRIRPTPAPIEAPEPRAVLFISRQRLVGSTNGSSTYLIALAAAARDAGLIPHLLQPSPTIFGRTPFFRLRPEMAIFESIRIRSSWASGNWRIVRSPDIFINAFRGVVSRSLRKWGFEGRLAEERKAPYSIAAPWTNADLLYVARFGRGIARIIITDYIFQTEALPYLLDPDLTSATVMHDLFSARVGQFGDNAKDSVTAITVEAEIELLARADAVVAIQSAEATFVAEWLPGTQVVLAPMAVQAVSDARRGDAHKLLFVGSNTSPNVIGLRWFLDDVWPIVRQTDRQTRLQVAGTVAAAFDAVPQGVDMLGLVPDLDPLYAEAGVVISPLLQGTGLKIKLVEAMANGKAIVATPTTLQGFEHFAGDSVLCANDAPSFAAAISRLQGDDGFREKLAARALAAAAVEFGPAKAFAEFRTWLTDAAQDASANCQTRTKSTSR